MTLPKIDRRAWLAVWAQDRRRRRQQPDLSPAPVTLLTDLLAYWNLDEAANEVRADSSGNGNDLLEWDYWGGTPTVNQTPGVLGDAALFTDSIEWGLLKLGLGVDITEDFSVAFWFNASPGVYSSQHFFGNASFSAGFLPDGRMLGFSIWTDAGWVSMETPEYSVFGGTWMHAAVVQIGQTVKIYINGSLSAEVAYEGVALPDPTGDFYIGCGSGGYPLNGALDEMGVWQRALTDVEVGQLYNFGDGLGYEMF